MLENREYGEPVDPETPRWKVIRSKYGYGFAIWLGPRIRFNSTGALTPMWPFVKVNHDEWCNPVLCIHLWPLGGLDTWFSRKLRTEEDGMCQECLDEIEEMMKP